MYLLAWQLRDRKDLEIQFDPKSNEVWIDADSLLGVPEFRTRREGDLFSPPGLRSMHRKLKKFFQERGVERTLRDSIPLLACEDQVLWIVGHAVSGNFQVRSETQTVLELRLTCHRTTNSRNLFPK
jgi:tRNA(Ile)-lysidine synthetase-like protein